MYTETNKLPSTSSKWQFANHFFSNKIIAISLDNHNEDEKGHLVWTQGSYKHLWKKDGRR